MKNRIKKALRATDGFTLVELVVVLVILSILATMTVPALTGYLDNGKRKQAVTEAQNCVLTGNALAAAQRSADVTDGKTVYASWAGTFASTGPAATGTLMLNEGSGAYYAEDADGSPAQTGDAVTAITKQAKVPGTINKIQFSAGGQIVYLKYTSGNTLVTYTNNGAGGTIVSAVETPSVPAPVETTPTPAPTAPPSSELPKVTFVARDESGAPLTGSTFILTSSTGAILTFKSGDPAAVQHLPAGSYALQNTAAPFGYAKDSSSIYFAVAPDGSGKLVISGAGSVSVNHGTYKAGSEYYVSMENKAQTENLYVLIEGGPADADADGYTRLPGIPMRAEISGMPDDEWKSSTLSPHALKYSVTEGSCTVSVRDGDKVDAMGNTKASQVVNCPASLTFSLDSEGKTMTATPTNMTYVWDAATRILTLRLTTILGPATVAWSGSEKTFADNTIAFTTKGTLPPDAPADYSIDNKQYTAPDNLADLAALLTVWQGTTEQTYSSAIGTNNYTLLCENYNSGKAGHYKVLVGTTKGYTVLSVDLYDYQTRQLDVTDGRALTLQYLLPWDFYKTRAGAMDASTWTLKAGNIVTEDNKVYITDGDVSGISTTAPGSLSTLQSGNSNDIAILNANKPTANPWNGSGQTYDLNYFGNELKVYTPGSNWSSALPTWCYMVTPFPVVNLSVVDSLSFDYLSIEYYDYRVVPISEQKINYATLDGVKFTITDTNGNPVTAQKKDGTNYSGPITVNAGDPATELCLPAGTYLLVQNGMVDAADAPWYACSDNENETLYPNAKYNMASSGTKVYCEFTVAANTSATVATVTTVNLIYRPYLTVNIQPVNSLKPMNLDTSFVRYKYDSLTPDVNIVNGTTANGEQRFDCAVPGQLGEKFELLPRSDDSTAATAIDILIGSGHTDGYARRKLYITPYKPSDYSGFSEARRCFNYKIDINSPLTAIFDSSSMFRVSLTAAKSLKLEKLEFKSQPSVITSSSDAKLELTYSSKIDFSTTLQTEILEAFTSLGKLSLTDTSLNSNYRKSTSASAAKTFWNAFLADTGNQPSYLLDASAWCFYRTDNTSSDWYFAYVNSQNTSGGGYNMYFFRLDTSGSSPKLQVRQNPYSVSLMSGNSLGRINYTATQYQTCVDDTSNAWVDFSPITFYPLEKP